MTSPSSSRPTGELCAFLSVEAEPPFTEVFALGIVAFHGLGLGAAIVSENERRALRFGALAVQSAPPPLLIHAGALAAEPRVSTLLGSRGYREVGEETYEDFRHRHLDAPEYDPALWFIAWDKEDLAGYVGAQGESREDPSRGYIALLGVRRACRRRGLGEALLRHAFRALHARGRRGVDLHVDADSVTGATRLYARVGMSAQPRFATWEKELRPPAPHVR